MIFIINLRIQLNKMNFKNEFYRKLIHLASVIIPMSYYYFFSREIILLILLFVSICFIIIEILRINNLLINQIFFKVFGLMIRKSEKKKFTGATITFISCFFLIMIFEKNIAVYSMLILCISDAIAAIVGKKWGKNKIFDKTFEGSLTFFLISTLIGLLFLDIKILGLLISSIIATVAELIPSPINDNIIVPFSVASTISFYYLFV